MAAPKPKKKKTLAKATPKPKKSTVTKRSKVKVVKKVKKLFQRSKKLVVKQKLLKKVTSPGSLQKFIENPIITPSAHQYWESKATFNPSALYAEGKVHILYRAVGTGDVSMLGHAVSKDGFTIYSRSKRPVYFHQVTPNRSMVNAHYSSGGGGLGGCEDPHITLIDDRVYMIYTMFDGWGSIRIALTSIAYEDFVRERWNWRIPVLISPQGEIHKNWVLFPEKINGKYAILHSIVPKILIEYVDKLETLGDKNVIRSVFGDRRAPKDCKGLWPRGVGPSPIKTKYGWLVLNHVMDVRDPNKYKIGAMILDLKDPTKVIAEAKEAILEPDEWYENSGHKAGVVYSCGAVVVDDWLFVYYGGADTVVCVATAKFETFLEELMTQGKTKLISRPKPKKK
jgi:beta-1,2-mannobiose phosphorylase / 1,2-beta-oligomannan phosphorylase